MVAGFDMTGNDYCVTEGMPNLSKIKKEALLIVLLMQFPVMEEVSMREPETPVASV